MREPLETIERRTDARTRSERILVRAPSANDAMLTARVLEQEGHEVVVLDDLSALARESASGVGAFLIATEALDEQDCCTSLREILDAQETWSEIPVVLLGRAFTASTAPRF